MPPLLHGHQALGGGVNNNDDGVGKSFKGRQRERLQCPECAAELEAHHQAQHGTGRVPQWATTLLPPDLRLYMVSFLRDAVSIGCPVEG